MRKSQLVSDGFEDGREPWAKECGDSGNWKRQKKKNSLKTSRKNAKLLIS